MLMDKPALAKPKSNRPWHEVRRSIKPEIEQCWWIVATEPRREKVAEESLRRDAFDVYYPLVKAYERPRRNRMSHSQRRRFVLGKEVMKPLFPSYLFIQRGDGSPGLARLFELTGIRGVVHFGENLVVISPALMQKIRAEIEGGLLDIHSAVTPFPYAVNEEVRVCEGAFAGFHALIERIDESKETIQTLVNLFGRHTRVALSLDQVEKL